MVKVNIMKLLLEGGSLGLFKSAHQRQGDEDNLV